MLSLPIFSHDGGFTKLGVTPGGGVNAGKLASTAGLSFVGSVSPFHESFDMSNNLMCRYIAA